MRNSALIIFARAIVGFLAYRLERASEPNGSRAKILVKS
jgi:hypothetical protein